MKEKEKSYDSLEVNTNKNLLCEYRMDFSFNMKRKKNFNGKNFALCIAGDLKVFQGFGEERIQNCITINEQHTLDLLYVSFMDEKKENLLNIHLSELIV